MRRTFGFDVLASTTGPFIPPIVIGVNGVVSYLVTQRRRDMGIRLALGADGHGVVRMIVRQALTIRAIGVVLGVAASLPRANGIRHLLFEIEPNDRLTFAAVPLVLGLCAALASYVPARRAVHVHPAEALRAE